MIFALLVQLINLGHLQQGLQPKLWLFGQGAVDRRSDVSSGFIKPTRITDRCVKLTDQDVICRIGDPPKFGIGSSMNIPTSNDFRFRIASDV